MLLKIKSLQQAIVQLMKTNLNEKTEHMLKCHNSKLDVDYETNDPYLLIDRDIWRIKAQFLEVILKNMDSSSFPLSEVTQLERMQQKTHEINVKLVNLLYDNEHHINIGSSTFDAVDEIVKAQNLYIQKLEQANQSLDKQNIDNMMSMEQKQIEFNEKCQQVQQYLGQNQNLTIELQQKEQKYQLQQRKYEVDLHKKDGLICDLRLKIVKDSQVKQVEEEAQQDEHQQQNEMTNFDQPIISNRCSSASLLQQRNQQLSQQLESSVQQNLLNSQLHEQKQQIQKLNVINSQLVSEIKEAQVQNDTLLFVQQKLRQKLQLVESDCDKLHQYTLSFISDFHTTMDATIFYDQIKNVLIIGLLDQLEQQFITANKNTFHIVQRTQEYLSHCLSDVSLHVSSKFNDQRFIIANQNYDLNQIINYRFDNLKKLEKIYSKIDYSYQELKQNLDLQPYQTECGITAVVSLIDVETQHYDTDINKDFTQNINFYNLQRDQYETQLADLNSQIKILKQWQNNYLQKERNKRSEYLNKNELLQMQREDGLAEYARYCNLLQTQKSHVCLSEENILWKRNIRLEEKYANQNALVQQLVENFRREEKLTQKLKFELIDAQTSISKMIRFILSLKSPDLSLYQQKLDISLQKLVDAESHFNDFEHQFYILTERIKEQQVVTSDEGVLTDPIRYAYNHRPQQVQREPFKPWGYMFLPQILGVDKQCFSVGIQCGISSSILLDIECMQKEDQFSALLRHKKYVNIVMTGDSVTEIMQELIHTQQKKILQLNDENQNEQLEILNLKTNQQNLIQSENEYNTQMTHQQAGINLISPYRRPKSSVRHIVNQSKQQNNPPQIRLASLLNNDQKDGPTETQIIMKNITQSLGIKYQPFVPKKSPTLKQMTGSPEKQLRIIDIRNDQPQQIAQLKQNAVEQHMNHNSRLSDIKDEIRNQIAQQKINEQLERKRAVEQQKQEEIRMAEELKLRAEAEAKLKQVRYDEMERRADFYLKTSSVKQKAKIFYLFVRKIERMNEKSREILKWWRKAAFLKSFASFHLSITVIKERVAQQQLALKEDMQHKKVIVADDFYQFFVQKTVYLIMKQKSSSSQKAKSFEELKLQKQLQIDEFIQKKKSEAQQPKIETGEPKVEDDQQQKQTPKLQKPGRKPIVKLNTKIQPKPEPKPAVEPPPPVVEKPKSKKPYKAPEEPTFIKQQREREELRQKLKTDKEKLRIEKEEQQKIDNEKKIAQQKERIAKITSEGGMLENRFRQRIVVLSLRHYFTKITQKSRAISAAHNKKHQQTAMNDIKVGRTIERKRLQQVEQRLIKVFAKIQKQRGRKIVISMLKAAVSETKQIQQQLIQKKKQNIITTTLSCWRTNLSEKQKQESTRVNNLRFKIMKRTVLHIFRFNKEQNALEKAQNQRKARTIEEFKYQLEEKNYSFRISKFLDDTVSQIYDQKQPPIPTLFELELKWGISEPKVRLM